MIKQTQLVWSNVAYVYFKEQHYQKVLLFTHKRQRLFRYQTHMATDACVIDASEYNHTRLLLTDIWRDDR